MQVASHFDTSNIIARPLETPLKKPGLKDGLHTILGTTTEAGRRSIPGMNRRKSGRRMYLLKTHGHLKRRFPDFPLLYSSFPGKASPGCLFLRQLPKVSAIIVLKTDGSVYSLIVMASHKTSDFRTLSHKRYTGIAKVPTYRFLLRQDCIENTHIPCSSRIRIW